jgi:hypothetical protein
MTQPLGLLAQGVQRLAHLQGLIGRLTLLRGHQIHTLRLLVQRGRKLTVDLKLIDDAGGRFSLFSASSSVLSSALRFTLALAVELIAQACR